MTILDKNQSVESLSRELNTSYKYRCLKQLAQISEFIFIANKQQLALVQHDTDAQLALVFYQENLSCAYKSKTGLDTTKNPVAVDFINGETGVRTNQANINSEAVVKTCIRKKSSPSTQTILDCTGGFGQDASMLAKTGAQVIILERNILIGLLLADGINRLCKQDSNLKIHLLWPASVIEQTTRDYLAQQYTSFTTGYLDPMYPHKGKSAKVNKNMQFIQLVVGSDVDSTDLFTGACQTSCKHLVIKRPKGAPFIANTPTKDYYETKGHRFDIYLNQ